MGGIRAKKREGTQEQHCARSKGRCGAVYFYVVVAATACPVDSFDKLQAASPSLRRFVSFDRLKFPLSSVTASSTEVLQRSRARPTTTSRMQLMS